MTAPSPDSRRSSRDDEPETEVEVPVWRRDFPYSAAGEDDVTRREFARFLALGSGAMAAGTVGLAVWTQLRRVNTGSPRPVVDLHEVAVGDTYLFDYPEPHDPAILLRLSESEVVGFSQKCTHLGCVVYYEADLDRWHCPCHEGNFDAATGAVLSGPPTRPLGRIELEVRGDTIWALGAEQ